MKKFLVFLFMNFALSTILSAQQQSKGEADFQPKSFSVQKGGLLSVDVDPGAVQIEAWPKDEVVVDAEGIDQRHPDWLTMTQSGNTITIKYRDTHYKTGRLVFTIKVPSNFNADIHTSGGSVKQSDVLTGDFKAETEGGSIKIEHIIGKVDVETDGGSIKVEKVEGDVAMKTSGGSIDVGVISGMLHGITGGGSISLYHIGGTVDASTGGGSIKVEDANAPVDLSTGGGSVSVSGAKNGVKVKTGGGSIDLKNIKGWVNAKTGGGSIECELTPDGNENSMIATGGGEIQLYLPHSAKAVVEATINIDGGWGKHHKKYTIHSDFKSDKLENEEDSDRIYAKYSLNGGGPTITLQTSDSDIEILEMTSK